MWDRASSCAGCSGRTISACYSSVQTSVNVNDVRALKVLRVRCRLQACTLGNDHPRWITCSSMQMEQPTPALLEPTNLAVSLRRAAAVTSPHAQAFCPQR